MKQNIVNICVIGTLFLLLSVVIIAPQIQSESIINKINHVENNIDKNNKLLAIIPIEILNVLID